MTNTCKSLYLLLPVLLLGNLHSAAQSVHIDPTASGVRMVQGDVVEEIDFQAPNIAHVHIVRGGKATPRTMVIDPALPPAASPVSRHSEGGQITLATPRIRIVLDARHPFALSFCDPAGHEFLGALDSSKSPQEALRFHHAEDEDLYGMTGMDIRDTDAGLLRNGGAEIHAGSQGNGGAPFVFTRRFGILIDSDGGTFDPLDESLRFERSSRPDVEYFVILGPPLDVMSGLATLTGHAPMPPKWTLGFLNSQWGTSEAEIKQLTAAYREKHIPIDAFILDFDWKAWGEDNYGEWRWNSTSGAGAVSPNKFPDGASGVFAANLSKQGIKLAGILKPRILVTRAGSTTQLTMAAQYAQDHGFWYPNEVRINDYFTNRLAGNLDFNNPEMRAWYWDHLKPSFQAGMVAWWNDEADTSDTFLFNNFQFMNMARMLWDGQHAVSDQRVWSINRNFYLGASRYGYALWSGDISTGFQNMAYQRRRMLGALNIGVLNWSMDTGGFNGHPSPENYARWMEFGAFVPVFRVHGTFSEKRQPWVYGPVAEAAAKRVMQLRYSLMPYIYSAQHEATERGISIVRPMLWAFPDDPVASASDSEWMFGDGMLVSPVVKHGATEQEVYLPAGIWYDFNRGRKLQGGQTLHYAVDAATWQDIPLFVRDGGIIASQPPQDYVGQAPVPEITLDIFAGNGHPGQFTFYDDDGSTYAYEKGTFYRQQIETHFAARHLRVALETPTGTYDTALRSYLLKIHRPAVAVDLAGKPLRHASAEAELSQNGPPGWVESTDKFGPLTLVRIPARGKAEIEVR